MPHATDNSITMTNGDKPTNNSKFLSHLTQYPVVSDGVSTFQNNPYGRKSLELTNSVYAKASPYLEKPYGYAKPYVAKADELADAGLDRVDERFPVVREETGTLVEKGKGWAWWPLGLVGQGRDYVFSTYNDEYNKTTQHSNRQPGLTTSVQALISTELKIASDFFQQIANFLGPKYEESKSKAHQLAEDGTEKAKQLQAEATDKVNEYAKLGEQKADEAKKEGAQKTEMGKKEALKKKEEAEKKVQQAQK